MCHFEFKIDSDEFWHYAKKMYYKCDQIIVYRLENYAEHESI